MSPDSNPPPPPDRPDRWSGLPGRIESWRDAVPELTGGALRRARVGVLGLGALFVGVIVVYDHRAALLGIRERALRCGAHVCRESTTTTTLAQIVVVVLLIFLGWTITREVSRVLLPSLNKRVDPATAGTIGFLVRLGTLAAAILVALHFAGVNTATIAIGASFTAVVFGLAAQQTLGNLIAGLVLLSARPFRVGEHVRLQGGPLAGQIEGVARSFGLLYTTFVSGENSVLVPNSVVLAVSVTPLHEPSAVSLRARLRPGTTPLEVQQLLEERLTVALRRRPSITLEELDGPNVVVKISATPMNPADGGTLASELLGAISARVSEAAQPTT
ncbi:MAG: mechanosensitive ion channel family protein [Solirubrobacteraceae bacterium]|jgi:small-conductance mechanosensitive channel